MAKSYADLMNEISADELYNRLLAHGLFADKLPPILSSVDFYNFCQKNTTSFSDSWKQYIYYESLRNINVPRPLGIPNPMAYQRLCRCLSDNWGNLQQHFEQQTVSQDYKISRIHIRKQGNSDAIFSMSYSNWRVDGSPEPDLLIGKRYIVKADISTCFLTNKWAYSQSDKPKGCTPIFVRDRKCVKSDIFLRGSVSRPTHEKLKIEKCNI